MTRVISLPASGRQVTLASYVKAVKAAKANPTMTFKHGPATWWPVTGAEFMQQFMDGVHDRINEEISYNNRGRATR